MHAPPGLACRTVHCGLCAGCTYHAAHPNSTYWTATRSQAACLPAHKPHRLSGGPPAPACSQSSTSSLRHTRSTPSRRGARCGCRRQCREAPRGRRRGLRRRAACLRRGQGGGGEREGRAVRLCAGWECMHASGQDAALSEHMQRRPCDALLPPRLPPSSQASPPGAHPLRCTLPSGLASGGWGWG